ncbi:hypothetical protein D9619_006374 [Psilocybe cf. subviscida]|uniref:EXPERA domain-containing protein n=1 Tax=Psilocybe cf. subviscida TaxID=2480587 RepID=A0A8H5B5G7_9AGAR|nr:hypothetical protein D9619_006374 [Psilocybe cf. subviscida]
MSSKSNAKNASARVPLAQRPVDLLYFSFFAIHTFATLVVDLQYLYPADLIPGPMRDLMSYYVATYGDPLIGGLLGAFGDNTHLAWFKSFLYLEAFFQLPIFIVGLQALYNGSRGIYPLLAVYGASSATTTLACVMTVLAAPSDTGVAAAKSLVTSVTETQRIMLLSSYIPFLIVPLFMAVDMTVRTTKLVQKAVRLEDERKTR